VRAERSHERTGDVHGRILDEVQLTVEIVKVVDAADIKPRIEANGAGCT
jgi:hypothetical protein